MLALGLAQAEQLFEEQTANMMDVYDSVENLFVSTPMDGGTWDSSLPHYRLVRNSDITEIEFCKAAASGWLAYQKIKWANGQWQQVGSRSTICHTVKLNPWDCITKVTSHAGGYVEEWQFETKLGSWGMIGKWDKVPSPPQVMGYNGQRCLKGIIGRTNGNIVQQGYVFGNII